MKEKSYSVVITEKNNALRELSRSWATPVFSAEDGIGPMATLHQAGDALVAVGQVVDDGLRVLGSGIMVGPGLLLTASHVLEEFSASGTPPAFFTFLPEGLRAWLPTDRSTSVGPSAFDPDRKKVSDITLVSCTLNSEAHAERPLMLAPLRAALPLVGERLWAFGFRDSLQGVDSAAVTPLVSSGKVRAVFPSGRGERMAASCIELDMEAYGGMSGGPVVNDKGEVVAIVSSSLDGGPTFATLIWDALGSRIKCTVPPYTRGDIDLLVARDLGLVRLKGDVKRKGRSIVMQMSTPELGLLVESMDPPPVLTVENGRRLSDSAVEEFEETWSGEMEDVASDAGLKYLRELSLELTKQLLTAADVPPTCLDAIQRFNVVDMEGLEDPETLDARQDGAKLSLSYSFDLLSVVWTVDVDEASYQSSMESFDAHFENVCVEGEVASMELLLRCYFEADLVFDFDQKEFESVSIRVVGIKRKRTKT